MTASPAEGMAPGLGSTAPPSPPLPRRPRPSSPWTRLSHPFFTRPPGPRVMVRAAVRRVISPVPQERSVEAPGMRGVAFLDAERPEDITWVAVTPSVLFGVREGTLAVPGPGSLSHAAAAAAGSRKEDLDSHLWTMEEFSQSVPEDLASPSPAPALRLPSLPERLPPRLDHRPPTPSGNGTSQAVTLGLLTVAAQTTPWTPGGPYTSPPAAEHLGAQRGSAGEGRSGLPLPGQGTGPTDSSPTGPTELSSLAMGSGRGLSWPSPRAALPPGPAILTTGEPYPGTARQWLLKRMDPRRHRPSSVPRTLGALGRVPEGRAPGVAAAPGTCCPAEAWGKPGQGQRSSVMPGVWISSPTNSLLGDTFTGPPAASREAPGSPTPPLSRAPDLRDALGPGRRHATPKPSRPSRTSWAWGIPGAPHTRANPRWTLQASPGTPTSSVLPLTPSLGSPQAYPEPPASRATQWAWLLRTTARTPAPLESHHPEPGPLTSTPGLGFFPTHNPAGPSPVGTDSWTNLWPSTVGIGDPTSATPDRRTSTPATSWASAAASSPSSGSPFTSLPGPEIPKSGMARQRPQGGPVTVSMTAHFTEGADAAALVSSRPCASLNSLFTSPSGPGSPSSGVIKEGPQGGLVAPSVLAPSMEGVDMAVVISPRPRVPPSSPFISFSGPGNTPFGVAVEEPPEGLEATSVRASGKKGTDISVVMSPRSWAPPALSPHPPSVTSLSPEAPAHPVAPSVILRVPGVRGTQGILALPEEEGGSVPPSFLQFFSTAPPVPSLTTSSPAGAAEGWTLPGAPSASTSAAWPLSSLTTSSQGQTAEDRTLPGALPALASAAWPASFLISSPRAGGAEGWTSPSSLPGSASAAWPAASLTTGPQAGAAEGWTLASILPASASATQPAPFLTKRPQAGAAEGWTLASLPGSASAAWPVSSLTPSPRAGAAGAWTLPATLRASASAAQPVPSLTLSPQGKTAESSTLPSAPPASTSATQPVPFLTKSPRAGVAEGWTLPSSRLSSASAPHPALSLSTSPQVGAAEDWTWPSSLPASASATQPVPSMTISPWEGAAEDLTLPSSLPASASATWPVPSLTQAGAAEGWILPSALSASASAARPVPSVTASSRERVAESWTLPSSLASSTSVPSAPFSLTTSPQSEAATGWTLPGSLPPSTSAPHPELSLTASPREGAAEDRTLPVSLPGSASATQPAPSLTTSPREGVGEGRTLPGALPASASATRPAPSLTTSPRAGAVESWTPHIALPASASASPGRDPAPRAAGRREGQDRAAPRWRLRGGERGGGTQGSPPQGFEHPSETPPQRGQLDPTDWHPGGTVGGPEEITPRTNTVTPSPPEATPPPRTPRAPGVSGPMPSSGAPTSGRDRFFIVGNRVPEVRAPSLHIPCLLVLEMNFVPGFWDHRSCEYQDLLRSFNETVLPFFSSSVPGFQHLEVRRVRPGSVVIQYDVVISGELAVARPWGPDLQLDVATMDRLFRSGPLSSPVLRSQIPESPLDLCSLLFSCPAGFECALSQGGNASCTSLCHRDFCRNQGICTHLQGQGPLCQCPIGSDFWFMGQRCDYRVTRWGLLGLVAGILLAVGLVAALAAYAVVRRFKATLVEARVNQTRSSYRRFCRFDDTSGRDWGQSWLGSASSLDNLAYSHSEEQLHLRMLDYSCCSCGDAATIPATPCVLRAEPQLGTTKLPSFYSECNTSSSSINDHGVDSGKASDISGSSWPMDPPFPLLRHLNMEHPPRPPKPHSVCGEGGPATLERSWTA
ncbi:nascent polypeptide-associated complex subunit alpha, muscle-specific form-like [Ornithorhynchus anatinus]|uniref:EGF-like domain-containing protein n=1 Tax=Ornithorhynchus anatinus TaxID=9258 RepID=A0A6I8NYQ1_ORNAN|nr:nascent polypeptide-associated complex subunit alpha, muscle-specific form-like [Ornithorhynchus anatinus]